VPPPTTQFGWRTAGRRYDNGGGWIKMLVFVLVFSLGIERNQPIAVISWAIDDPQSGTYLGTDGYRHPCP
jgi:hypothetical protein